jgi:hypothetical protein
MIALESYPPLTWLIIHAYLLFELPAVPMHGLLVRSMNARCMARLRQGELNEPG